MARRVRQNFSCWSVAIEWGRNWHTTLWRRSVACTWRGRGKLLCVFEMEILSLGPKVHISFSIFKGSGQNLTRCARCSRCVSRLEMDKNRQSLQWSETQHNTRKKRAVEKRSCSKCTRSRKTSLTWWFAECSEINIKIPFRSELNELQCRRPVASLSGRSTDKLSIVYRRELIKNFSPFPGSLCFYA